MQSKHTERPVGRVTVAFNGPSSSPVVCRIMRGSSVLSLGRGRTEAAALAEARRNLRAARKPRTLAFRSLAHAAAALPLLLCLIGAVAAQPTTPRTGKPCTFVYINGDLVISCPKAVR